MASKVSGPGSVANAMSGSLHACILADYGIVSDWVGIGVVDVLSSAVVAESVTMSVGVWLRVWIVCSCYWMT